MTDRHAIVACARQFLGVRFAHQGRSATGLDCLGLLMATARAAGLTFNDKCVEEISIPTYTTRPDTVLLYEKLYQFLVPIKVAQVQIADIVLLTVDRSPQHLAILTDYPVENELGMVHAYALARKVVEHRYDEPWRAATYAAFRLPQLS